MSQSRIPYDVCATNEQQKQSEGPGNRQLEHPSQRNIMSHSVPAGIDNVHFVDEFSVFQDRIQMESELLTIGNKIQRCVPADGGNNRPTMHNSKAPFQKVESHRFLVPTDNPKEKSQSRGQEAFNVFFTHDLKPNHGIGRAEHIDTRQLAKDQYKEQKVKFV